MKRAGGTARPQLPDHSPPGSQAVTPPKRQVYKNVRFTKPQIKASICPVFKFDLLIKQKV